MRFFRLLFIFFIILILFGCSEKEVPTYCTILFDNNDGEVIDTVIVEKGKTISLITPVKEGYSFEGWFLSLDNINSKFTEDQAVNEDMTLYAKWKINQYTVTFDYNDQNLVSKVDVYYQQTVNPIEIDRKNNMIFQGWYTDTNYNNPYNFSEKIVKDTTLYAKWEMITEDLISNIRVIEDTCLFDLDLTDLDITVSSVSISLYLDEHKVRSLNSEISNNIVINDLSFKGLSQKTNYQIMMLVIYQIENYNQFFEFTYDTQIQTGTWESYYVYLNQIMNSYQDNLNYIETVTMNAETEDQMRFKSMIKFDIDLDTPTTGLIKVLNTFHYNLETLYQQTYFYHYQQSQTTIHSYTNNQWMYYNAADDSTSDKLYFFEVNENFTKKSNVNEYDIYYDVYTTYFTNIESVLKLYEIFGDMFSFCGIPKVAFVENYNLISFSVYIDPNTNSLKQIKINFKELCKTYFGDSSRYPYKTCELLFEYSNFDSVYLKLPTTSVPMPLNQIPNNGITELVVNETYTRLNFQPIDSEIDFKTKQIFLLDYTNKKIIVKNILTKSEKVISFPYDPVAMYIKDDYLYVAMQRSGSSFDGNKVQSGAVMKIDINTLETIDTIMIDLDPFDIIVTNYDIIIVSSASAQHTTATAYNQSGTKLGSYNTYMETKLVYSKVLDKLYTMETTTYPKDICAVIFSETGQKLLSYDSIYYNKYAITTIYDVSPDGKYIYNGSGHIFTTGPNRNTDIIISSKIPYKFSAIAFDLENDRYFIACGDTIITMKYSTNEIISYFLTGIKIYSLAYQNNKLVAFAYDYVNNSYLLEFEL